MHGLDRCVTVSSVSPYSSGTVLSPVVSMLARSRFSQYYSTSRRNNDNDNRQRHANSIATEREQLARWSEGSNRFVMLHAEPCLLACTPPEPD